MIYTPSEIAIIRASGKRLAEVLLEVVAMVEPGVSTASLDAHAERRIRELDGAPSFLGFSGGRGIKPFPSTLCTSINNEIVHAPALPGRVLKKGDIVGIDIGMRYPAHDGYYSDMAVTVGVGKISKEAELLIEVTKEALHKGINVAVVDGKISDIGKVIQNFVESAGFSVVRALVGHGVGRAVHEEPEVPNFYVKSSVGNHKLQAGLVIAIEPMVNVGRYGIETQSNQWTITTQDKSLSAHFEHTIVVTNNGPEILTKI